MAISCSTVCLRISLVVYSIITIGCAQALDDALKSYTWAIGISVVLLCLIEIVAVVSAFRLARKQREAA
ncbi:unnamed protein product [Mesocestoides corti]|uniref:Tetraspanin n=1 Tax=Mesocestoides corti TaxID=53468 RepID=A0A0R3UNG5_MESCO|nr:unnamed protein product [Mesocestoides corti]